MANRELLYTLSKVAFYRKLALDPMGMAGQAQQGMLQNATSALNAGVQKFQQGAQKASQKAQEMAARITGAESGPPKPDAGFQQMAGNMGFPMGGGMGGGAPSGGLGEGI